VLSVGGVFDEMGISVPVAKGGVACAAALALHKPQVSTSGNCKDTFFLMMLPHTRLHIAIVQHQRSHQGNYLIAPTFRAVWARFFVPALLRFLANLRLLR
jgi:hypothetical protein